MTMQREPIYHSIITSKPPQEDHGLGKATERIFLPLLRMLIPDIVDYDLPAAGRLPQLRDRLDPQALPEARAEDHERGLGRPPDVADQADRGRRRGLRRARLPRGGVPRLRQRRLRTATCCSPQGPVDHLDHASYQQFWGGKAGIDATRKLPAEGYTRGWPEEMTMSPEVVALVDKRWKEYGI